MSRSSRISRKVEEMKTRTRRWSGDSDEVAGGVGGRGGLSLAGGAASSGPAARTLPVSVFRRCQNATLPSFLAERTGNCLGHSTPICTARQYNKCRNCSGPKTRVVPGGDTILSTFGTCSGGERV